MMKPVMNLDEVECDGVEEYGLYTSSRATISDHIGARNLGYNLTVLPPGKVQCPFHCHHGEEEMFFILDGEGELRFGEQRFPIRRHEVIACPPGGPEVAHQIINTGSVVRHKSSNDRRPQRRDEQASVCQDVSIRVGKGPRDDVAPFRRSPAVPDFGRSSDSPSIRCR